MEREALKFQTDHTSLLLTCPRATLNQIVQSFIINVCFSLMQHEKSLEQKLDLKHKLLHFNDPQHFNYKQKFMLWFHFTVTFFPGSNFTRETLQIFPGKLKLFFEVQRDF